MSMEKSLVPHSTMPNPKEKFKYTISDLKICTDSNLVNLSVSWNWQSTKVWRDSGEKLVTLKQLLKSIYTIIYQPKYSNRIFQNFPRQFSTIFLRYEMLTYQLFKLPNFLAIINMEVKAPQNFTWPNSKIIHIRQFFYQNKHISFELKAPRLTRTALVPSIHLCCCHIKTTHLPFDALNYPL